MEGTFNPYGLFLNSYNIDILIEDSFPSGMLRVYPNGTAPLFAISSQLKKVTAKQQIHNYQSKIYAYPGFVNNGAIDDTTTTLTVVDNAGILADQVYMNQLTREMIRVTADPTDLNITIVRAYGEVAAATIADATAFVFAGNSHTVASSRPSINTIPAEYITNYTQIFRNAWGLSRTDRQSRTLDGWDNITETRNDCIHLHATAIETSLWWGQAVAPGAGANRRAASRGIEQHIENQNAKTDNVVDLVYTANATTNYDELVDMTDPAFFYTTDPATSDTRMQFGDRQAVKVLNEIGRRFGTINMYQGDTSFGMSFGTYQIFSGRCMFKLHPLWSITNVLPGTLITIDLPAIGIAYLQDTIAEDISGYKDGSAEGLDADVGGFLTEFALEHRNARGCTIIRGLTKGSA